MIGKLFDIKRSIVKFLIFLLVLKIWTVKLSVVKLSESQAVGLLVVKLLVVILLHCIMIVCYWRMRVKLNHVRQAIREQRRHRRRTSAGVDGLEQESRANVASANGIRR